ncbi:MAG: CDP-alcohol phosphatidyltransferase family protein, partial [Acidimicrobiia bacterium]|nr:CDP-alcohol phosphatidyltransferase family protein [Acidimicrobiia bacterium]
MLDAPIRRRLDAPLARVGQRVAARGIPANAVTAGGFGLGVAACVAVAFNQWPLGLALWLANRLADGVDGSVARAHGSDGPTDTGGFLDIMSDFAIYGGMVVAIGYAVPEARLAALAVFLGYYLSGSAFLAWS